MASENPPSAPSGNTSERPPSSTDSQEKPLAEPKPAPEHDAEKQPEPPAAKGPGPPPNGGLTAWLQVLGAFMLFFNTWGFLNTFGVFQTYYESGTLFHESSSNIAWIGSIQAYMLLTIGFVSGPIYDRGYLRTLVVTGTVLIVLGLMMLSICKTYWEVLLCQGFVVGIGAGCLFVPCVAVLPTYFTSRLGLAVGTAVAGASLGGVIYPIVLDQLLDRVEFGWSVRACAFIALGTQLIPIAVMKMRLKPPKPRSLTEWSAFKDWTWDLFTLATFVGFTGLAITLFFVSFYGADQGIASKSLAFYIVTIFNASSTFGRVIPNAIADKTGPFNIIVPGTACFGILTLCMVAVKTTVSFIVLGILLGFFSGLYIALPPICFVALTDDKTKLGSRMGMSYSIIAFSMLAGGAGGGQVLGFVDPLNWTGLWVFGGVMCCASSVLYGVLRVGKYGWKLNIKA